jgi:hypothetical protein
MKEKYSLKVFWEVVVICIRKSLFRHKMELTWHSYPFNQNEIWFIETNSPEVT